MRIWSVLAASAQASKTSHDLIQPHLADALLTCYAVMRCVEGARSLRHVLLLELAPLEYDSPLVQSLRTQRSCWNRLQLQLSVPTSPTFFVTKTAGNSGGSSSSAPRLSDPDMRSGRDSTKHLGARLWASFSNERAWSDAGI